MLSDLRFAKHATWGCLKKTPGTIKEAVQTAAFTLGLVSKVLESRKTAGLLTTDEAEVVNELAASIETARLTTDIVGDATKLAADNKVDLAILFEVSSDALPMHKVAVPFGNVAGQNPMLTLPGDKTAPKMTPDDIAHMLGIESDPNAQAAQVLHGGVAGGMAPAAAPAVDPVAAALVPPVGGGTPGGIPGGTPVGIPGMGGGDEVGRLDELLRFIQSLPDKAREMSGDVLRRMQDAGGDVMRRVQNAGGDVMRRVQNAGDDVMEGVKGVGKGLQGAIPGLADLPGMLADPSALGLGAGGAAGLAGLGGLGALVSKLKGRGTKAKGEKKAAIDFDDIDLGGAFGRALDHLGVPAQNAAYIMGGKTAGLNIGVLSLLASAA